MSEKKRPVVSVITAVWNAESLIEQTIRSIAAQTYPHIEMIVVDGVSKDGTLDIVRRYHPQVVTRYVSEPDRGFYDAMDKGVQMATGDYVCFINAGDEFYEPDTLAKIFDHEGPYADVYYGDTMLTNDKFEEIGLRRHKPLPEHLTWKSFRWGSVVCHQSIFVRRTLAPRYDLTFPRSGDIEWSIRALKASKTVVNTHTIISKYLVGGLSAQHRWRYMRERFWIGVRHFGFLRTVWDNFVMVISFIIRRLGGKGYDY